MMRCKSGDYAYIMRGEFSGIVVSVDEIWWHERVKNVTVWGVTSRLTGEETRFACPDNILFPFCNVE